jgi:hypothetical protein
MKLDKIHLLNLHNEFKDKKVSKPFKKHRVKLYCGDTAKLAYDRYKYDSVFMSLIPDLFDIPEIPIILNER